MSKIEIYLDKLNKVLVKKYRWQNVSEKNRNRILNNIKWNPDLLFRCKSKLIAIDINLSNAFPVNGAKEIIKAKKQIKDFEFYFCVPQDYDYDQIFSECFNNGFGIIRLDNTKLIILLEPKAKEINKRKYKQLKIKVSLEYGHIPRKLLEYVNNLQRISYKGILKNFVSDYSRLKKGKNISETEYDLVDKTVKKIFNNKQFHYSSEPYLRLKYYERLLSGTREHYLHSFQVMLMGCVVLDKYYLKFAKYYTNIFPNERDFSIEYIWLMVSIFHDIGYPSQEANSLIGELYGYNEEIDITGIDKIADKEDYKQAATQLQSFIRHCCCKRIRTNWTPEMVDDADPSIKDILRNHLIKQRSHGVTSCFQFLTSILRESKAVSERASRPLIVTHIIPAVASIALHDDKLWEEFKKLKIFPININHFPFAVLLIFLDSLHDWKRNKSSEEIPEFAIFDGFVFTGNCVEVKVYWNDPEKLAKKLPEYQEVNNNIKFNGLKLKYMII